MLVKEIMTKKVISIDYDKTVFDASNMYKKYKVGSLIVTKKGECIGIVTERNIIERTICEKKDPIFTRIEEIMTSDPITIHPLETIDKALTIMMEFNIKKLPVVSEGGIVGIITVTDISRARPDLSKRFMESWVKPEWVD